VLVKSPKYRKSISGSQIRLLELLFKFRFVSVPLVSEWLAKDKSTIYERLLVLVEQGYVQKTYDSTYRLPPKPASYSLAAKGIRHLRDNNAEDRYSELALKNMYKNRSASVGLVDYSLDLFKLCLQLRNQYPDTFHIFTKSEMTRFDDFVRPLPDLYLKRIETNRDIQKTAADDISQGYVLETLQPGIFTWILKKRIKAHQTLAEGFEDEFGYSYPTLLFICGNLSTEQRIQKIVEHAFLDYKIWTTTMERLTSSEIKIWRDEWDEDEVLLRGL